MQLTFSHLLIFKRSHTHTHTESESLTVWAPSPAAVSAERWAVLAGSGCSGADGKPVQLSPTGRSRCAAHGVSLNFLCNALWPCLGPFLFTCTSRRWHVVMHHALNTVIHFHISTSNLRPSQRGCPCTIRMKPFREVKSRHYKFPPLLASWYFLLACAASLAACL